MELTFSREQRIVCDRKLDQKTFTEIKQSLESNPFFDLQKPVSTPCFIFASDARLSATMAEIRLRIAMPEVLHRGSTILTSPEFIALLM
jgi:hypothetical protein